MDSYEKYKKIAETYSKPNPNTNASTEKVFFKLKELH